MRVSSNSLPDSLIGQLHRINGRQARLQTQAASGQRLQWAADDPAAMGRALELQTAGRTNTQYANNVDFLSERTTVVLSSIRSVNDVLDRANEIAVLAGGPRSTQELTAYASEVDQLIRQAAQAGNVRHRGDFVLGGTATSQAPFVLTENAAGQVDSVTFQGNTDVPQLEVSEGSTVAMQIPGANTSGSGPRGLFADSRTGTDTFAHLIALRDHLAAGDTQAIANTDRPALTQDEDQVLLQLADSGALQSRLEFASATSRNQSSQIREALSRETDVDLAETMVELSAVQTAYQAALQSGASILGVSLMDYLR